MPSDNSRRGSRAIPCVAAAMFGVALTIVLFVWFQTRRSTAEPAGIRAAAPTPARPGQAIAPGYLTLDSSPAATVFVDDVQVGSTPLIRYPVAPGQRRVRAVTDEGRERTFEMTIEPSREAPARAIAW